MADWIFVMTGPIGFAFRMFDALLGLALLSVVGIGGAGLFLLGGAPKQYELNALGGVYTVVLRDIEDGARGLRDDYCTQADETARGEAACAAPHLAR